jgi:adenosylcobinamide amidohydrolase
MIPGLRVTIDERAVVVAAERPLRILSSAVLRGGLVERAVVNLHVDAGHPMPIPSHQAAVAPRACRHLVGLLTAAPPSAPRRRGTACVPRGGGRDGGPVNRTAGRAAVARWTASTINIVVLVTATLEPAAS